MRKKKKPGSDLTRVHDNGYAQKVCPRQFVHANVANDFEPLFVTTGYQEELPGVFVARDIGIPIPDYGIKGLNGIYSAKFGTKLLSRKIVIQLIALGLGNLEITHKTRVLQEIQDGTHDPDFRILCDVVLGTSQLRISLGPNLEVLEIRLIAWGSNKNSGFLRLVRYAGSKFCFISHEENGFSSDRDAISERLRMQDYPDLDIGTPVFNSGTKDRFLVNLGDYEDLLHGKATFLGVKPSDGKRQVGYVKHRELNENPAYRVTKNADGKVVSVSTELPWDLGPLKCGDLAEFRLTEESNVEITTSSASIVLPMVPAVERQPLSPELSLEQWVNAVKARLEEILVGSVLIGNHLKIVINA